MHDGRDAPVPQLHEVVNDGLGAQLIIGRDGIQCLLAPDVVAHYQRDVRSNLLKFSDAQQRGHQHQAVYLEVDHRIDDRPLLRRLETAGRVEQLIGLGADHA